MGAILTAGRAAHRSARVAVVALACAAGAAGAQDAVLDRLAPNQIAAVTVSGTLLWQRDRRAAGTAFALTDRLLVTAAGVAGRAQDFVAAADALPAREVVLALRRPPADRIEDAARVVAPEFAQSPVALLAAANEVLLPLPLSACPLTEGTGYHLVTFEPAGADATPDPRHPLAIAVRPQFRDGLFTRGLALAAPVGRTALGGPVLDGEGRVVGAITDLSADGTRAYLTPAVEIAAAAPDPQAIALACDPRVLRAEFDTLRTTVTAEIAPQLAEVRQVLGDVTSQLQRMQELTSAGGNPAEEQLVPAVTEMNAYLRRPEWSLRGKLSNFAPETGAEALNLKLSYVSALAGRPYARLMKVCVWPLLPGPRDDFLTPAFFDALDPDQAACDSAGIGSAGNQPVNSGAYAADIAGEDLRALAAETAAARGVPEDAPWSGLAYLKVSKGREAAELRALIDVLPDDGAAAAMRVLPCRVFADDSDLVDFLTAGRPADWTDATEMFDPARLTITLPADSETCASTAS